MDAVKQTPDIIYEDNHLLICVKPFNVPSQADRSHDADMLTLLKAYIKRTRHKPGNVYLGLVHRLDRPAGGLMVFAKTSKAASRLSRQIREGSMDKRYLLRTQRAPHPSAGVFEDYVKKGSGNMVRVVTKEERGAKYARLAYRTLKVERDKTALVEAELFTGRPHQIRVQFASRGYALIGDARYGKGGTQLKLWSAHLGLTHPVKATRMNFDAPTPADF